MKVIAKSFKKLYDSLEMGISLPMDYQELVISD